MTRTIVRLFIVALVITCAGGCDGETVAEHTPHVTSDKDVAPTPDLPRNWYPFRPWPGSEKYSEFANQPDRDLTATLPPECPTHVEFLNVYLTGQVRGGLRFNQHKRGGRAWAHPMNGGNTTLGGFEVIPDHFQSWKGYKYQVEMRFLGPLEHAFYGQMISDPQAWEFVDPEFHEDTPANDWPGKRWNLAPGDKKSDFPVIEIVTFTGTDHFVRYIDAPGGSEVLGIGLSDRYMYVLIYAGACGVVTHTKYLQLYYPDMFRWTDGTPIATELTLDQFRGKVGNWTFRK